MWGSGGIGPGIFDRGTDGGKWSASRPSHLTPHERAHGACWIGGQVGRRASVEKNVLPSVGNQILIPRPSNT
jgi:hypothetical protein